MGLIEDLTKLKELESELENREDLIVEIIDTYKQIINSSKQTLIKQNERIDNIAFNIKIIYSLLILLILAIISIFVFLTRLF